MNVKTITSNKIVTNLEKEATEKLFRRYDELVGSEYLQKVLKKAEYFNPRTQYEMPKYSNDVMGQKIDFIF